MSKSYETCEYFTHVKDGEIHIHYCHNKKNPTNRCGYNPEDWKKCPLHGLGKIIKVDL